VTTKFCFRCKYCIEMKCRWCFRSVENIFLALSSLIICHNDDSVVWSCVMIRLCYLSKCFFFVWNLFKVPAMGSFCMYVHRKSNATSLLLCSPDNSHVTRPAAVVKSAPVTSSCCYNAACHPMSYEDGLSWREAWGPAIGKNGSYIRPQAAYCSCNVLCTG